MTTARYSRLYADGQVGQLLNPSAAMAAGTQGRCSVGAAAAFSAVATILAKLNLFQFDGA